MTSPWQRQRQPDDVPTPMAVAVSDFCRRAKAPAPATEVREALALLREDDDFRVRALTDAEPEATPLGPFAVVDILGGTPAALAAQRQACGFYQVAQELARVREEKTPPPAPAPTAPTFALPPAPAAEAEGSRKPARGGKPEAAAVQDRIAPRKRPAADVEPEAAAPEGDVEEPRFLRKDLPRGRGRFTRVEAPRQPFHELAGPDGKKVLAESIEGSEHRFTLLRTLANRYNGTRGDLSLVDLEGVVRDHGLADALKDKERGMVLEAYSSQRGAAGRVAWALGVSPSELQRLVRAGGLEDEVEALRDRFRREALAAPHLTHRLDLLGRDKYLADLGIQRKFADGLRKELERLVSDSLPDASDLHGLAESVGRKHGAPGELVFRAFERLGLAEGLRKQLSGGAPSSTP